MRFIRTKLEQIHATLQSWFMIAVDCSPVSLNYNTADTKPIYLKET